MSNRRALLFLPELLVINFRASTSGPNLSASSGHYLAYSTPTHAFDPRPLTISHGNIPHSHDLRIVIAIGLHPLWRRVTLKSTVTSGNLETGASFTSFVGRSEAASRSLCSCQGN